VNGVDILILLSAQFLST